MHSLQKGAVQNPVGLNQFLKENPKVLPVQVLQVPMFHFLERRQRQQQPEEQRQRLFQIKAIMKAYEELIVRQGRKLVWEKL